MRTVPALAVAAACSLAASASPVRDGQKTLGAEYGLDREHKSVITDHAIDYDELLRSHPAYHRISRPELQRLREHYSCDDKDAECLLKNFPEFDVAVQDLATEQKYLLELAPGKTLWASDMDKLNLRRQGVNFFDVTDAQDLGFSIADTTKPSVEYPEEVAHQKSIKPLLKKLNKNNMKAHLTKFSSFWTRYYKSDSGKESSVWLLNEVEQTLRKSGATKNGATVRAFPHPWGQNSIIAQIPGKSNSTVVIGAHQDSINLLLPALFQAPGADDDGSGTVTILEALRVLLKDEDVVAGKADNTIEFHWYSAEEGGLLGSQALFLEYEKQGRDVKAMLQQDMTGYVTGTLDAGQPESVGVIEDYVDPGLTEFIKKVIVEYCDIPFVLTKCGYACSDHASASKAGYPSAFVIESEFKNSDRKIHTTEDKLEFLSFDHMLQHARLTLGLVYELGFAKL